MDCAAAAVFARLHQLRWSAAYVSVPYDIPLWPLAYAAATWSEGPDLTYHYSIDVDHRTQTFQFSIRVSDHRNREPYSSGFQYTASLVRRGLQRNRWSNVARLEPFTEARARTFIQHYMERYMAWWSAPRRNIRNAVERYRAAPATAQAQWALSDHEPIERFVLFGMHMNMYRGDRL